MAPPPHPGETASGPVAAAHPSRYAHRAETPARPRGARGLPLAVLRRLRPWFLAGAILIFLILFAGLIHDFGQADVNVGWFTANPALPIGLLVLGYLLMLGHRLGSRGEEEG